MSSLNTSESGGVLSAADYIIPSQQMSKCSKSVVVYFLFLHVHVDDTDLAAYVPVSANLHTYCHIYNFTDPYLYPYQKGKSYT